MVMKKKAFKMKLNLLLKLLGASVFSVSLGLGSVVQAKTVLKVGHVVATTNAANLAAERMAEVLREKSGGDLELHIFPNSQLGGERELVESIQLGNLDVGIITTGVVGAFEPKFFALDTPFLFKDRPTAYRVLDGAVGDALLASLDGIGIKGLGWWENGFRHVTNSKRPIQSVDDLKGLKLRTMENEIHIAMWKSLGANPAPLAFGELFTALQQGTFDGQENPIDLFHDMKFQEVQKYMTLTGHIYAPYVVMANPEVWASLSDKQREAFMAALKEGTQYERELKQIADQKALADMPNLQVTELTDAQRKEFIERANSVVDLIKKKAGAQTVEDLMTASNAN